MEKKKEVKERMKDYEGVSANLMEVCGTHTMACAKYGIYDELPSGVKLLSGPGCPVCVTDGGYISSAIRLSRYSDVIITTFGDMLRVPSEEGNLESARAEGGDIRVVYSAGQSVEIAKENPGKKVVFLAVGFETTIPTVALAILSANMLDNLSFLTAFRIIPPALEIIANRKEGRVDGFILPGHVSVIIGKNAYSNVIENSRVPGVISGFSAEDILTSINRILQQITNKEYTVINNYKRVVSDEGNIKAKQIMKKCFDIYNIRWRGLGVIPDSGMKLREEYSHLDTLNVFDIEITDEDEPEGCSCGDVLMGLKTPLECKLYSKVCKPDSPIGPCMVSSEGACAAYYKYGRI